MGRLVYYFGSHRFHIVEELPGGFGILGFFDNWNRIGNFWAFRGRNFIGNFDRLRNCRVGLVHNAGLRHCRTSRRRAPLGHSPMTRSSTPRRAKGPAHQDTGERIPQPPRSRDRPERSALRKAERTRRAEAWPAMDSAGAVIGPVVHSLSYCSRRCIQSLAANPLR